MVEDGTIVDAASLRALAHPIRWALIEALGSEGTATATRCAELLGESQATCSFHLRQLARFGMIEEAPSTSKRERPWRLKSVRQSWSTEPTGERSRDDAARQLSQVFIDRETERIRRWSRTFSEAPAEWRQAAAMSGVLTWLTPEELAEFGAELAELLQKRSDRIAHPDRRPPGARPVRLFGIGFPVLELDPGGGRDE
jgi:predicted ArsR family transcriptional regulator